MATKPDDNRQVDVATDHDPVWEAFLNAPFDDEPLTEEDIQAIKEADEDFAAGRGRSWKDIKEELDL
ncbi:MAG: hypothetical protein OXH22_13310 [Chloroflexi bacterium]|nr:hypothetical protein [Chloroflexota bacterium]